MSSYVFFLFKINFFICILIEFKIFYFVYLNIINIYLRLIIINNFSQDDSGELIFYERTDTKGPKLSEYKKISFSDKSKCEEINDLLSRSNGKLGVVKKIRLLYIVGQSRIHVDKVDELGDYMEIEV